MTDQRGLPIRLLLVAWLSWSSISADILVVPGTLSSWMEESGQNSGGTSSFECPATEVLIARQHQGDENGNTQYQCGTVYDGSDVTVTPQLDLASWGPWIEESGKDSGGESRYECPTYQVLIGREHSGDENGNTRYECAPYATADGAFYGTTPQTWSQWLQESGKNSGGISSFSCPSNQVMIGRAHRGDENGDTQYLCAIPYGPISAEVYQYNVTSNGNAQ